MLNLYCLEIDSYLYLTSGLLFNTDTGWYLPKYRLGKQDYAKQQHFWNLVYADAGKGRGL